jgi:UDP-N-acetylenolpyruvoylglucosamine reductase
MSAYIFEGEDTAAVKKAASEFAKEFNCQHREGEAPCNKCTSCRTFQSGNHPDTFYVAATETKSIGVGDVRAQVIDEMATRPFSYRYKVFIIDKAETLTPAAQNALLKTMEEPAPFGVFLLLADKMEAMLEKRKKTQPLQHLSCGSVFRNPDGAQAGSLIEEIGLKGCCIGGAVVSEIHANFIVNTNNATADDVLGLIIEVQAKVKEKYDIELQPEVKFLGFA